MDAQVVYQVVKALPKEEQRSLLDMLRQDLQLFPFKKLKKSNHTLISDQEAIVYLIKNVFQHKKYK